MRILGIDYGAKKIGLALGVNGLISPLAVIGNRSNHPIERDAISKILKIISSEHIDTVVVGLPLLHGEETGSSKTVREFAQKLNRKVIFVDEFGTSKESVSKSIAGGVAQNKRREDDAIAAGNIIHRYLEQN